MLRDQLRCILDIAITENPCPVYLNSIAKGEKLSFFVSAYLHATLTLIIQQVAEKTIFFHSQKANRRVWERGL